MKSFIAVIGLASFLSLASPIFAQVQEVTSKAQYDTIVANNKGKLVVVDFYAPWCGPCKGFTKVFNALSDTYPAVVFVKVNIDNVPDLAAQYSVSSIPTFNFVKNNAVVCTISGADKKQVEETIKKHQ
ncbi:MAG TPA: thioredoxin domain-containing protein [Candidatus Babeliales bacterium]|nr:thioredoxin domain-containing protein [Candidatus Babeliales bacterium]